MGWRLHAGALDSPDQMATTERWEGKVCVDYRGRYAIWDQKVTLPLSHLKGLTAPPKQGS